MKRRFLVLLAAAVIGGLTFLIIASRPVDFDLYDRTVEDVGRLDKLNTALGEAALRMRYRLVRNYDPLVTMMTESEQDARRLLHDHFASDDPDIGRRIAEIVEYLNRQEDWLHTFQSLNSVLDNSLTYLPSISHRLSELSLGQAGSELQRIGEDLVVRLLRIDDSTSPEDMIRLDVAIAALEARRSQIGGEAGPVVDDLVRHARVVVRYGRRVEEILASLTDPYDNLLFDRLAAALRVDYLDRLQVRGRYRVALYVLSLALLAAIGFLVVRLRATLTGLEQRRVTIERKQLELADANRELHDTVAELQGTQAELIAASRKSGMAEVATAVLHNVGNVLNSVNASAELVTTMVAGSKIAGLRKAVDLLRQNQHDLAAYLGSDPRGRHLPAYLEALATAADEERSAIGEELSRIRTKIDHIKAVVRRQQSTAKASATVVETLAIERLVDEALAIVANSERAARLCVVREYQELPPVTVDRHRIFQVVVNLLTNACHAVASHAPGEGRIIVRLGPAPGGRVGLEVEDNGYGIPAQNLHKIFNHGFSTKKHGHGFGLHDSANAMTELGGQLAAYSDGPGKGARFRLELPIDPEAPASAAS